MVDILSSVSPAPSSHTRPQLNSSIYFSLRILEMPLLSLREYVINEVHSNPVLKSYPTHTLLEKEYLSQAIELNSSREFSPSNSEKNQFFTENLENHLMSQVRFATGDKETIQLAEQIIGNLDDNGYLSIPLNSLEINDPVSAEKLQSTLQLIQSLDPAGIAARDLRECLLIQLTRDNKNNWPEYRIVSEYFNDLKLKRIHKISKKLGLSHDDTLAAIGRIKALNPKPGKNFVSERVAPILPDFYITYHSENNLFEINTENINLPLPVIDEEYIGDMKVRIRDKDSSNFLKQKMKAAKNLIQALKSRQATLYRIMEYLVKYQFMFLRNGNAHLKPLGYKQVAEHLKMHPSTVSRAVKYTSAQISGELIPLKDFFSREIPNGDHVSDEQVKFHVRQILNTENPLKPFSDSQICDLLRGKGFCVSRRTIAKYRHSLQILPSYLRKVMK